ncbi:MAG: hypothetical protein CMQ41_16575 [Gammaproteobacteria bacterium]|mgnify:CR=1 FL=1|nr:hypothetical protein [Gammaproteobacteria bacterium]MBM89979.1 hypothetical protein [Gammaproteobacteria bacterium]|tara:strand:+ start:37 stop:558 length:522 start_codon:yes stop_codon:yes gene_type:complete
MKILIAIAQLIGFAILIPATVVATLWLDARGDDGPSVIFRGGVFTTGTLYQGTEPNWSFTDDIRVVELQLNETQDSRTTFIIESNGRIFVTCDYMGTPLGRAWKQWAVRAAEGSGAAELRIGNVRYERTMKRITEGPEINWVIEKKIAKYGSFINQELIASGEIWVFEFAPRV